MKKQLLILLATILVISGIWLVSSGSFSIGSEATTIVPFGAQPLGIANTCNGVFTLTSPCTDTDNGYDPLSQGFFAGSYISATLLGNATAPNNYIAPSGSSFQCAVGLEFCDPVTGELQEAICGSNVGIPNAAAFNAALTPYTWGTGNILSATEPASLVTVNCATYASNNPGLGLAGICSNGACI